MGYDFGTGASGAMTGAQIGSTFGPWGTGAGAVLGAGLGLFGGKKKGNPKKRSTLDPEQQRLYQDYISSIRGEGPLSNLHQYDAEGANQNFDANVARPAYRDFQENIIPGITGQFRGNNLMNSSYTGEALGRAGRNVQENLDAQRSNMQFQGQQQAKQNQLGSMQNILAMNTQSQDLTQQKPSGIDAILGQLAPGAGDWFSKYLTAQGSKFNAPTAPTNAQRWANYAASPALA